MAQAGDSVKNVSAEEAKSLVASKSYTYLDVRTPEEFAAGHVDGAVNIPYMFANGGVRVKNDAFLEQVKTAYAPNVPLVLGCATGIRSANAGRELQEAGYSTLVNLEGGITAWTQKGLPTVR